MHSIFHFFTYLPLDISTGISNGGIRKSSVPFLSEYSRIIWEISLVTEKSLQRYVLWSQFQNTTTQQQDEALPRYTCCSASDSR